GRERLQRAVQIDQRVVRRQRFELVGRGHERQAGVRGNLLNSQHVESRQGIQSSPHRRATQRQLVDVRQRRFDVVFAVRELRGVSGKLLPQRERRRVLQMRTPDLHDIGERRGLVGERHLKRHYRGKQRAFDRARGGNVHGGGKYVVRRLAHV